MPYSLEYFNERVLAEIERWPVGVLADYARIVERVGRASRLREEDTGDARAGPEDRPPPDEGGA